MHFRFQSAQMAIFNDIILSDCRLFCQCERAKGAMTALCF